MRNGDPAPEIGRAVTDAPLRALVVDDERLARARLRRLLGAHPEVRVIAEADSALAARTWLCEHSVDVVFLDVNMPDADGFSVLHGLEEPPRVVFVTAHQQHAVRAFEVQAEDYLLKPVDSERLARCVARLGQPSPTPSKPSSLITLTTDHGLRVVERERVALIRAAGDYTEVFLSDGTTELSRSSMRSWDDRLSPHGFIRTHRGALVRIDAIRRFERDQGAGSVWVRGVDTPAPVGRRACAEVRRALRARDEET